MIDPNQQVRKGAKRLVYGLVPFGFVADALPRNRLNAGKYLVVVKGTEDLTRQATRVLRQFEPENIQGYTELTSA